MKYTLNMTVYDDDGDEAFNSFMIFFALDDLEKHLDQLRPNFTPLTEITLGISGGSKEMPSAEIIDRIQRLQNSCPDVSNN